MKPEENKDIFAAVQERVEENIRDAKHWLGGWDELRKLIDQLEDNEKEKAYENPKY